MSYTPAVFLRAGVLCALLFGSTPVFAWKALSGLEIRAHLNGKTIQFETGEVQSWAGRKTVFKREKRNGTFSSEGQWRIRWGRYCSRFGFADWTCFEVATLDESTRFVGPDDVVWVGRL